MDKNKITNRWNLHAGLSSATFDDLILHRYEGSYAKFVKPLLDSKFVPVWSTHREPLRCSAFNRRFHCEF